MRINHLWKCAAAWHIALGTGPLVAQYPWPVTPFNQSQTITGTFCEYRDTESSPHYHNGVDIPKPDGSPAYPVRDGRVTFIDPNGDNAYVRVEQFTYLHIRPNPGLFVGDSVYASTTVLGTINPGLGHVHLIERNSNNVEINALRAEKGLEPYDDPWPPAIRFVRFFQEGSGLEFENRTVSGPVDIVVHVEERNGPPGSADSRLNNGTYKLGYQILSADRKSVVYSPPSNGLRFQFDAKPSANVHNTFDRRFSNTSTHVYIVTNTASNNNYWDTALVPEGDYTVMVFTEDTRRNVDTAFVPVRVTRQDLLAPAQPLLLSVTNPTQAVASWRANGDLDLQGYRLYRSSDNVSWTQALDENNLDSAATTAQLSGFQFGEWYVYLTAVDTVSPPNESMQSDVYGYANSIRPERILIVDGFDRMASWQQAWHWFTLSHGRAIASNSFSFESCANEAITSGVIALQDYDAVIWILGDESTADETFSAAEQGRVQTYLQNGGNLFVSGSEIAWDLDRSAQGGASDDAFLSNYLKSDYVNDDAGSYTVNGMAGTFFEGLSFSYGSTPYSEDYPDVIQPSSGSVACLRYGNGQIAGISFDGTFPGGARPGKLIYLGFPFETIAGSTARAELMRRALEFFFPTVAVAERASEEIVPRRFILSQNYPNPFNPSTNLSFGLPMAAIVRLEIFNVLGQSVRSWPGRFMSAGFHHQMWDATDNAGIAVGSGEYYLRMLVEPSTASGPRGTFVGVVKMNLVK